MSKSKPLEAYKKMETNELVRLAKEGDPLAFNWIYEKFEGIVHGIINIKNFFMPGGEYADLYQEGIIGIYKAVMDFKEVYIDGEGKERKANFDSFVTICIRRNLITSIKASTRNKHIPLNQGISLNKTLPDNENLTMMDILAARAEVRHTLEIDFLPPDKQLELKDIKARRTKELDSVLSTKEKTVFYPYLDGKSYKEIEDELGIDTKAIDNAIQRVRRKIKKIKNNETINTRKTSPFPR